MNKRDTKFVNIGFNNIVNRDKVISVLDATPLPSRRLISEAKEAHKALDASRGRKTKAIIVTESGHVILCGLHTETICQRLNLEYYNTKDEE